LNVNRRKAKLLLGQGQAGAQFVRRDTGQHLDGLRCLLRLELLQIRPQGSQNVIGKDALLA
jgi:hypothetical protein